MGAGFSKEEQLYQAVHNGNHQLVKSLRRDGASLEFLDKEGRTPLILACARQDLFDMVVTLLNLGANINAYRPGSNGGFPLHHAAKRGLERTVILLISRGADPLCINDDGQTPLDMARLRGHTSIVRIIEASERAKILFILTRKLFQDRIALFTGMIREVSGPGLLEVFVPQWVTKKVWVAVVPVQANQRHPPRHELAIYQSPKVAAPRTVISLWKADLEEPKWNTGAPVLIVTERATKMKYKFLSEADGDTAQLEKLYRACRGIPPVRHHPSFSFCPSRLRCFFSWQVVPAMGYPVPPLPDNQDDVALAMALDASLQSAGANGGWGDQPGIDGSSSSTSSYNGWGTPEPGQSSSEASVATPAAPEEPPSAPPLPEDDFVVGPIHYPSIDTSPVTNPVPVSSVAKASTATAATPVAETEKAGGQCVVCWDAPAQGVCIPCGHLAGCMGCLQEIKNKKWGCPVCRSPIEQVVKVFAV
ncbi:hypothetical protein SELMODRAFT_88643 [Selaginella moellendorffii]|uniref:RING-type domain-containing protein n=1 Tax=Selaginella moellendorffii TaxID=88036 RepID=D8RA02_SELML|nr:hypothetical protein SELMODRAFT_88643 [Selaginella moellendorffii]